MYLGWTQVAFDTDLVDDVAPVDIGDRPLVAVRSQAGWIVYDGRCPHRGAHLGYGGTVVSDGVLACPFHGHRIRLGSRGKEREGGSETFAVAAYPTLHAAGGLFVLLDARYDTGLADRLRRLGQTHHVRPAFERRVAVTPEYVIENVLDADHFASVHSVERRPRLEVFEQPTGTLRVVGTLQVVRPNKWQVGQSRLAPDAPAQARFFAEVFSPTMVVTELGLGELPPAVVTAATPTPEGGCLARVSVALPRRSAAGSPTVRELSSLISGSRTAFEQDALIWDHLDTSVTPRYVEGDALVRTYREFCRHFMAPER